MDLDMDLDLDPDLIDLDLIDLDLMDLDLDLDLDLMDLTMKRDSVYPMVQGGTMSLSTEEKWQRLAVLNKHPRDDRIQFQEEGHIYTVDGSRAGWVSCTKFLHEFFSEFDADAVIAKMMNSHNWPNSKYFGMTPEQIKKQWSDKATASSQAGTRMHLDIEHLYNAMPASGFTLQEAVKGLILDNWSPVQGPEWDYFCNFQISHVERNNLVPFRTEWLVFDPEHKLTGSIDMVFKKPDGTLAIYDWKRIEEAKTENRYQSGLGPVAHLPDVNYWHYTLQLNIYRYILQKHYGYTVSELALVVLHPINSSWRILALNTMEDEVMDMLAARARALAIPGNDGSSPMVVLERSG